MILTFTLIFFTLQFNVDVISIARLVSEEESDGHDFNDLVLTYWVHILQRIRELENRVE